MLESDVWQLFHRAWPYHSERQEHRLNAGQPDVFLLDKRGHMGLTELKHPDRFFLRVEQWLWHEMAARGKAYIPIVTCERFGRTVEWKVGKANFVTRKLDLQHNEEWVDNKTMLRTVARILKLDINGVK